jgi:hypothetical protein
MSSVWDSIVLPFIFTCFLIGRAKSTTPFYNREEQATIRLLVPSWDWGIYCWPRSQVDALGPAACVWVVITETTTAGHYGAPALHCTMQWTVSSVLFLLTLKVTWQRGWRVRLGVSSQLNRMVEPRQVQALWEVTAPPASGFISSECSHASCRVRGQSLRMQEARAEWRASPPVDVNPRVAPSSLLTVLGEPAPMWIHVPQCPHRQSLWCHVRYILTDTRGTAHLSFSSSRARDFAPNGMGVAILYVHSFILVSHNHIFIYPEKCQYWWRDTIHVSMSDFPIEI